MLSRRDKLLVRPWQQKKFENHRRKVLFYFLNREPIYNVDKIEILDETVFETAPTILTQKSRCLACCPDYQPPKQAIPEERIPWAPMKLPVAKPRSQSVPLPQISSTVEKQPKIKSAEVTSHTKTIKAKDSKQKKVKSAGKRFENQKDYRDFCQSLVLKRGNFKLVVNFPSDTTVSVQDAFSEKVLLGKPCTCKAIIKS
ncbi:28s ribosomal protein s26 mitochondrial [Holotrichia oblita]|uniref:28s ribosomal protein s26 mitochondrial n=1 Tax=Holotrichia oblita TaxID=644536 RepID=A0ACB9TCI8_HOLOL|nr:28s ribosomal protein s26 mitochondrial [Holotrichia oblita]